MYLDTALFLFGFSSLIIFGLLAYIFKISQSVQTVAILLMIFAFMYLYLFGLDTYRTSNYKKAMNTPQQNSNCGTFIQQIKFNIGRKQNFETAFQFKT